MARKELSIIGVDLAEQVFQLNGASAGGEAVFRKKLSRKQLLSFMHSQPACSVATEVCATARQRARTLMDPGRQVRLIAPQFVNPHVKKQKKDMADAEAITERSVGRRCALSR